MLLKMWRRRRIPFLYMYFVLHADTGVLVGMEYQVHRPVSRRAAIQVYSVDCALP